LGDGRVWTAEPATSLAISAMTLLLLWRHRENIRRLVQGTESRIGSKGR